MLKRFAGLFVAMAVCLFATQASAKDAKKGAGIYFDAAGTMTSYPSGGAASLTGTKGKGGLVGVGFDLSGFVVGGDIGDQILSVPGVPSVKFTHFSVYGGFQFRAEDLTMGVMIGQSSVKGTLALGSDNPSIDVGDGNFVEAVVVCGKKLGVRASIRHYINDPNGANPSPFKDMLLVGARLSF